MAKISIKRKIQNSMFVANIITLAITVGVIILVTQFAYAPIGFYITKSATFDFLKRYEIAVSDTAMKGPSDHKYMTQYSVQRIIDDLNTMIIAEESVPIEMAIASIEMENGAIVAKSEDDYKRIMVLAKEVYDDSNQFGVKLSLMRIGVNILDYKLTIPHSSQSESLFYENEEINRLSYNEILIVDEDGQNIGSVIFELNPELYQIFIVMVIAFLILLSLISIGIVKMVSFLFADGIVKPIHLINKQLERMATNEEISALKSKLDLKKPPLEIKEMIDHSNAIIDRYVSFNQQLELQNDELQMQNDELLTSREIIENQNKQLIQSEKMASIGQIAAAVVHEINTPIGAIKSNAQMMEMAINQASLLEPNEAIQKKLGLMKNTSDMIKDASNRIIEIVRSIKNFSRIDQSEFKDADLHEAIDSVLTLTSNLWKSRISIEKSYGFIPPVNCYIGLINQVVMNLVVNAIDAIDDAGTIAIETGVKEDAVYIKIKDTGSGIPQENLERIFMQGFTTKPMGAGSGLGLALSKDIMEKHQGRIDVESTEGVGSTFTMWIPIKAPDTKF